MMSTIVDVVYKITIVVLLGAIAYTSISIFELMQYIAYAISKMGVV